MTAIDAFTAKQLAFEQLHTDGWTRFAKGFTASMRGEHQQSGGLPGSNGFNESADEFTGRMARTLTMSEVFYVAPIMNALVTAAAEAWPEDEPVLAEDFPTTHGWIYIPTALTTLDIRGQLVTTTALTWAIRGETLDVVFWADKRNDSEHVKSTPGWGQLPQYTPSHVTSLSLGQQLPKALSMNMLLPPEVSETIKYDLDKRAMALGLPEGWSTEDLSPTIGPVKELTWLVAALRIMQQPLASFERKGLPANVRKGLARKKFKVSQKAVTVIDFRRRAGDFNAGTGREYSHRFLRRGHWRRQPYKREDGTTERRRIWIHATIVGDPDKPLVLRNHVNALTR